MRTQRDIIRELTSIRQRMYDGNASSHDFLMEALLIDELHQMRDYNLMQLNKDLLKRIIKRVAKAEIIERKPLLNGHVLKDMMKDTEEYFFGHPV